MSGMLDARWKVSCELQKSSVHINNEQSYLGIIARKISVFFSLYIFTEDAPIFWGFFFFFLFKTGFGVFLRSNLPIIFILFIYLFIPITVLQ